MSIMVTIFDVSIKEKSVNGSFCFNIPSSGKEGEKMKYMDLCQHANKYKQAMLETSS